MRPILAEAVGLARRALAELQPTGVGDHLGVSAEDDCAATHRFEATLPGYRGWQWAVVVAAPPEADHATVSESALLPGPDALVAPDFVPWDRRVRPGDLAPGDLLAPRPDDPRLVPAYLATGDPVVDEVADDIGLGRSQVLSREGRAEAAERWYSEYGPEAEMARAAPSTCGLCGFFLPLAGSLRSAFGVCGNAMGADGRVVHAEYGCGAHSDTILPTGGGSPIYEAYDDAAVEVIPPEDLRAPDSRPAADDPEPAAEDSAVQDDAGAEATPRAATRGDVGAPAVAAPAAERSGEGESATTAVSGADTGKPADISSGTGAAVAESAGGEGPAAVVGTGVPGDGGETASGERAGVASGTGSATAESAGAEGAGAGVPGEAGGQVSEPSELEGSRSTEAEVAASGAADTAVESSTDESPAADSGGAAAPGEQAGAGSTAETGAAVAYSAAFGEPTGRGATVADDRRVGEPAGPTTAPAAETAAPGAGLVPGPEPLGAASSAGEPDVPEKSNLVAGEEGPSGSVGTSADTGAAEAPDPAVLPDGASTESSRADDVSAGSAGSASAPIEDMAEPGAVREFGAEPAGPSEVAVQGETSAAPADARGTGVREGATVEPADAGRAGMREEATAESAIERGEDLAGNASAGVPQEFGAADVSHGSAPAGAVGVGGWAETAESAARGGGSAVGSGAAGASQESGATVGTTGFRGGGFGVGAADGLQGESVVFDAGHGDSGVEQTASGAEGFIADVPETSSAGEADPTGAIEAADTTSGDAAGGAAVDTGADDADGQYGGRTQYSEGWAVSAVRVQQHGESGAAGER